MERGNARYWLKRAGKAAGPFSPSDLILEPGFEPGSLVCPEAKAVAERRHWRPAQRFKDIAAVLKGRKRRKRKRGRAASDAGRPELGARYWLLMDGNPTGPMDPEALIRRPGFIPEVLVCREDRSVGDQKNWKSAKRFKDIAAALAALPASAEAEVRGAARSAPSPEAVAEPSSWDRVAQEVYRADVDTLLIREQPQAQGPLTWRPALLVAGWSVPVFILVSSLFLAGRQLESVAHLVFAGSLTDLQAVTQARAGEVRAKLARLWLANRGRTLEAELGSDAEWSIRRSPDKLYVVDIRGREVHPLTGRIAVCRLLYDRLRGTVEASDDLSRKLLGTLAPLPARERPAP